MFDIGFWEILLIVVLALIIIGPERLPGAAKKAGYWMGRGRRFVEGVRNEVESEVDLGEFKRLLHNQEVQINELQQKLNATVTNVDDVASSIHDEILTDVPAHSFQQEKDVQIAAQATSLEQNTTRTSWEIEDEAPPAVSQHSTDKQKSEPST